MVDFDVFAGKEKKVELNTCYNIKTEEEPIETKAAPLEHDNDLEEFFQAFKEEVRLFEEEKEGRMIVDIVKDDKIVERDEEGTMEEFIEEGMTDFEQLGWLMDNANMEIGTLEESEDEVIDMLVWGSGESHMEEESEEMPDIGSIPSSSSAPKLDLKLLPSTLS
ncbi:hypothetical protein LWI29_026492 [Acer saccharum]|uniref:Uncharacterized protein n=1 Tax=Acer saccharum TaxID=4024 RepID=A0AA39VDI5_ACESA|nr:hypothetical protein LWI29_026492 [Acer saccharum]